MTIPPSEIAEPRRETGARSPRDWLRPLQRCLSHCSQTGTGAKQKGTSPQQYGEGSKGEPASWRLMVAADRQL